MGERSSLPVSSPKLFFGYWKMEAGVIKSIKYIRLLCWFLLVWRHWTLPKTWKTSSWSTVRQSWEVNDRPLWIFDDWLFGKISKHQRQIFARGIEIVLVMNKEKHHTYTYEQLHTVTGTGKGAFRSFRKQPLKELNNSADNDCKRKTNQTLCSLDQMTMSEGKMRV